MVVKQEVVLVFRGHIIDCKERGMPLCIRQRAVLGVTREGRIAFVEERHDETLEPGSRVILRNNDEHPIAQDGVIKQLPPRGFLCPGFVDTHTHAPQFSFAGMGYDLQLLQWLTTYTFPHEAKFRDNAFAAKVCHNAVRRTLRAGTTTCMYFATTHTDAAVQLGRIASGMGQRALVGKVAMDRNAPEYYCEEREESLCETERFVSLMLEDAVEAAEGRARGARVGEGGTCQPCETLGPPALPVICPRFVPTCTAELLFGLAKIAAQYEPPLHITSHISENLGEIQWVNQLHPEHKSYIMCYDHPGLITPRTVLAHGVYLTDADRTRLAESGTSISHCPMSNSMLRSGCCNVRQLLDAGVTVSLGTDVCGGASPSMLSAIREAIKVSNLVSLDQQRPDGGTWAPLSMNEAFWLATRSGATSLDIEGVTGDFSVGAWLDALVVDPEVEDAPFDLYDGERAQAAFDKWLMLGDERNNVEVYVQGKRVLPNPIACRPCA